MPKPDLASLIKQYGGVIEAADALTPEVGRVVKMKDGRRLKVTTVHPDGSFDGEPPGLLVKGNIDLTKRPIVKNPDGSTSSVYSMGMTDENPKSPHFGKEVLVPSVIPNGAGGYYTDTNGAAARQHYYKTGEHMGVFDTWQNSDSYGEQVHNDYVAGKFGDNYKDAVQGAQPQVLPVKSHEVQKRQSFPQPAYGQGDQ